MRILITGASGLIGKALQKAFEEKGYEMLLATRSEPKKPSQIQWNADTGFRDEDLERLEGLDAVIHLAGEGIAGLRWTDEKKKAMGLLGHANGLATTQDAFAKRHGLKLYGEVPAGGSEADPRPPGSCPETSAGRSSVWRIEVAPSAKSAWTTRSSCRSRVGPAETTVCRYPMAS